MKSIKIDEEVYERLKKLKGDKSFNELLRNTLEAIEKAKSEAVQQYTEKLEDIREIAMDIATTLMQKGYFDIKLRGMYIENVEDIPGGITITGKIVIDIPSIEVKATLLEKFRSLLGGEEDANTEDT